MDFFAHQEAARKRTSLLLFYYVVAVAVLALTTYAAAMLIFLWQRDAFGVKQVPLWHPQIFFASTVGTLAVIALGSMWRMIELRQGGAAVAQMLGGTLLSPSPADEHEQRLRNVVEEMALASGTPVPEIYILEPEHGINAFAAGHTTNDAAIAVTRGCMRQLTRDELQGVVAHEFSHILNGDMRMNIRLIGVLHGILCIYLIGRILLRVRSGSSSSNKKGGNPLPLFGLVLIVIGGLGVFFGRLIQAAVSRQREFLADASAVQFTRNPRGIAGALKKIGGSVYGSQLDAAQASAASHLFFGNGLAEPWFGLTATHPPLAERIRRIEPGFDGKFAPLEEEDWPQAVKTLIARMALADPGVLARLGREQSTRTENVRAENILRRTGKPVEVTFAAGLLDALPAELREASTNSLNATALMFALVLGRAPEISTQQLAHLSSIDAALARYTARYAEVLAGEDPRVRLPLLNQCMPSIRTLSPAQWQRYRAALDYLVCCDAQLDLFEFVLKRVIERAIDAHFAPKKAALIQFYSFTPLAPDCAVLLSALAHVGTVDNTAIQRAFEEGAGRLPLNEVLPLVPASACGVQAIDTALARLAQAVPHIKKTVLEACAHAVSCDGYVNAEEAELLRAIGETLDCPIPPFVGGV